MYSNTEENYLKIIYKLQEKTDEAIHTNSIAKSIDTKAASVTDMIKRLSNKELLSYEKYKGVQLTPKGKLIAIATVRKHRLWETFLHDTLKFSNEEVHDIAEELEHINSNKLVDKLDEFLNFPTHDPHGDPIPDKNGEPNRAELIVLTQIKENTAVVMSGILVNSDELLGYLKSINLTLGDDLLVKSNSLITNSLILKIGSKKISMPYLYAKNILVKTISK